MCLHTMHRQVTHKVIHNIYKVILIGSIFKTCLFISVKMVFFNILLVFLFLCVRGNAVIIDFYRSFVRGKSILRTPARLHRQ